MKKNQTIPNLALWPFVALLLISAISTTHAMEEISNKRKRGKEHTLPIKKKRILCPGERQEIDDLELQAKDWKTTALILAVARDNLNMVNTLLEIGKDPNETGWLCTEADTPLHVVCDFYNTADSLNEIRNEIIETLLRYGANANNIDSQGQTPLHEACNCLANDIFGNEQLLAFKAMCLLLENHANPNIPDQNGDYPLTIITKAYEKNIENTEFLPSSLAVLLDHGADPGVEHVSNPDYLSLDHYPNKLLDDVREKKLKKAQTLIFCLKEKYGKFTRDITPKLVKTMQEIDFFRANSA